MASILEGGLKFDFDADIEVGKYDEWAHYRNQLSKFEGMKAVDIVCHRSRDSAGWLIEVKDFRKYKRTNPSELPQEIALKVVHTLAGLVAARFQANVATEKSLAGNIVSGNKLHVVLHLEQASRPSRLKGTFYDTATITQKLKSLLKSVDPRIEVVSISSPARNVPWSVSRV